MSDPLKFYLSLSIVFAVIIGIIRFRKINPAYYPFIYRVSLCLVVELVRRVLILHQNNAATIVTNIFSLADFLLFAWLFHNWGLFKRDKKLFLVIISVFFCDLVYFYIYRAAPCLFSQSLFQDTVFLCVDFFQCNNLQ